jgi:peptidyl-prolyl cis-trans isomerase C
MPLYKKMRQCALATALLTFVAPGFATAQDGVVARVGDRAITDEDYALAEADFSQELAQMPEDRRRAVLLDVLVDMELLAGAAIAEGLDKTEGFDRRLAFLRTRALRNAYVEINILNSVTDEAIEAEYQEQIKSFEPQTEVRARHILVTEKEEAEAIIKELDSGTDFAMLAKQKSTGPSGPKGGDLGYFVSGSMVPAFDKVAFELEIGAHTKQPVQTQFGWHVIKVEDRRDTNPPPVTELADQIRQTLVRTKFESVMADLKSKTKIEIVGAKPAE